MGYAEWSERYKKQTESKKGNSADEIAERVKRNQESNNSDTQESGYARWSKKYKKQQEEKELDNLINNYQNDYQNNAENYINRFTNGVENYKSDYSDFYNNYNKFYNTQKNNATRISYLLDTYKEDYGEEYVNKVKKYLDDTSDSYSSIGKAAQQDYDFYSQFSDEADFNYYKSRAKQRSEYEGKTDDELKAELEKLKEEKASEPLAKKAYDKTKSTLENIFSGVLGDYKDDTGSVEYGFDAKIDTVERVLRERELEEYNNLSDDLKTVFNEYAENKFNKETATVLTINDVNKKEEEIENKIKGLNIDSTKVEKYKNAASEIYNAEKMGKFNTEVAEDAKEHPVLQSTASILASPYKAIGVVDMVKSASDESKTSLDYNSPYYVFNHFVNTTRETVQDNVDWTPNTGIDFIDRDYFDSLYSTVMSTGDSVLSGILTAPVGGAIGSAIGGTIIGVQSATDTAMDVAKKGGTKEQALLTGLVAGVNESLWESLSIGNFQALTENPVVNGFKDYIKNVAKSTFVNASEEFNTEVANIFADYLINGDYSDAMEAYYRAISSGKSDYEARTKAASAMLNRAIESGLGGALQGLLMGNAGQVKTVLTQSKNVKAMDRTIKADDTYKQNLIDVALSMPENTQAHKLAQNITAEGASATDMYELLYYTSSAEAEKETYNGNLAKVTNALVEQGLDKKKASYIAKVAGSLTRGRFYINNDSVGLLEAVIRSDKQDATYNSDTADTDVIKAISNTLANPNSTVIAEIGENYDKLANAVNSFTKAYETKTSKKEKKTKAEITKQTEEQTEVQTEEQTGVQTEELPEVQQNAPVTETSAGDIKTVNVTRNSRGVESITVTDKNGVAREINESVPYYNSIVRMARYGWDDSTINKLISKANASDESLSNVILEVEAGALNILDKYKVSNGKFSDETKTELRQVGKDLRKATDNKTKSLKKSLENGVNASLLEKDVVKTMNPRAKAWVKFANTLSKVVGNKIVLYESETMTTESGEKKNVVSAEIQDLLGLKNNIAPKGACSYKDGTIYIDVNGKGKASDLYAYTLGHEYVHFIRASSTEKFNLLADFLVNELVENGTNVQYLVGQRALNTGVGFDVAYEEFIAECCEEMLLSEDFQEHFYNLNEKNKGLAQGLLKLLKKAWLAFKAEYKDEDGYALSDEALEMRKLTKDVYKQAARIYAEALQAVSGNYKPENKTKKAERNTSQKTKTKEVVAKNATTSGDVRYQIEYTEDNTPVVVIDENILHGIPREKWVTTVKNAISNKFVTGIPVKGKLVKVNKISKSELTNSKYTQYLKANDGTIYADKFKATNNLDEIILASTNYINEDLKHSRSDNIAEFARGDVLIRVGESDYSAKVIIGFTNGKNMVLYDIVDFAKTDFKIKKKTSHVSAMQNAGSQRNEMPSVNSISNSEEKSNKNFKKTSENSEIRYQYDKEYLELAKDPVKNEARLSEIVEKHRLDSAVKALNRDIKNIENLTDTELDECVRKLGWLNSLAYKGYRRLTDKQSDVNGEIYKIKDNAVRELANEYAKRGKDVVYNNRQGVIYFKLNNGIQISFHIPLKKSIYDNGYDKDVVTDNEYDWDGIKNSFAYTDYEEYKSKISQLDKAKELAKQTIAEINSEIYNYVSKNNRIKKNEIYKLSENNNFEVYKIDDFGQLYKRVFNTPNIGEYVDERVNDTLKKNGLDFKYSFDDYEVSEINPKILKLSDPVTYDDNGNIIPLSERFNDATPDIRYQDGDSAFIKKIKADYKTGVQAKEIEETLDEIRKIYDDVNIDVDERRTAAKKYAGMLANKIVKSQKTEDDTKTAIKEQLKGISISLNEAQKQEAIYTYGSVRNFANTLLGSRIYVRNSGGALLESLWETLNNINAYEFKADENTANMPIILSEVLNATTVADEQLEQLITESLTYTVTEYVEDHPSEVYSISPVRIDYDNPNLSRRDILANALLNASGSLDESEQINKYKHKINTLNNYEAQVAKNKAELRGKGISTERRKFLLEENRRLNSEILSLDKEILRASTLGPIKELVVKERERAVQSALKKSHAKENLRKEIQRTTKWLNDPRKSEMPCPDYLKKEISDVVYSLAHFSSGKKMSEQLDILSRVIDEKVKGTDEASTVTETAYLTEDFSKRLINLSEGIKRLSDSSKNTKGIDKLSDEQALYMIDVLKQLKHSAQKVNELHSNEVFKHVDKISQRTIKDLGNISKKEYKSGTNKFIKTLAKEKNRSEKYLYWDLANPVYAFKRFGEAGEAIFKELQDGQDKYTKRVDVIDKYISSLEEMGWTSKNIKKWENEEHKIKLSNGETITMTTAGIMSFYALSRREQGLSHLKAGGISSIVGDNTYEGTLSFDDIIKINNTLTKEQAKLVEEVQSYLSSNIADWGNEVSQKRYLVDLFKEDNYFPIKVKSTELSVSDHKAEENSLWRLINMGFTKKITPQAGHQVEINSFFDVVVNHMNDMAKYNAFALPMIDTMKWLNYREVELIPGTDGVENQIMYGVRKSMNEAFGENTATSYVLELVRDLNGSTSNYSGAEKIVKRLVQNAKVSAVGANARVALLQPTAYIRASRIISYNSLAKGLTGVTPSQLNNLNEMAMKYAPIAQWKSYGFYDINVSNTIEKQLKGNDTLKDKINDKALKLAEFGDKWTWSLLYKACLYEAAEKYNVPFMSEKCKIKAGWLLNDVVYKTQVVDSILTRCPAMRSKNLTAQELTAFMSEPILSYNIILDCISDIDIDYRRALKLHPENSNSENFKFAVKRNGGDVGGALLTYTLTNVFTALAEAVIDAIRDDDDERFPKKFRDEYIINLINDMSPINKIPVVKSLWDLLMYAVGEGYENTGSLATQYAKDVSNFIKIYKKIQDGSGYTGYALIKAASKILSDALGLPISSGLRECVTTFNAVVSALGYDDLKILSYERTDEENGRLYFEALESGKQSNVDRIKEKLGGEDDANKKLKAYIRNSYKAGETTKEKAEEYYRKYVSDSNEDMYWDFDKWDYAIENGSYDDYTKYDSLYSAVENGNVSSVLSEYYDHTEKKEDETDEEFKKRVRSSLASAITTKYKKQFQSMTKSEIVAEQTKVRKAYMALGYSHADAQEKIYNWTKKK